MTSLIGNQSGVGAREQEKAGVVYGGWTKIEWKRGCGRGAGV